jgi:hypothetical protein
MEIIRNLDTFSTTQCALFPKVGFRTCAFCDIIEGTGMWDNIAQPTKINFEEGWQSGITTL